MLASKLSTRRFSTHTSCGIVGYPNIGKSTLFNALARTQMAQAKNYPFCTIDPNVAKVAVHDKQTRTLVAAAKPEKVTPCQIEIWDIAGLIRGASEGAGLGNKFLANIRSVNAIVHLVRCFPDLDIIHVEDVANLDPISEMENVQTELILSDIEVCSKKKNKKGMTVKEGLVWDKVFKSLDDGKPVRSIKFTPDEVSIVKQLPLISAKPLIYACNIDADSML
jgi:ribosome-binding ATPase